MKKSKCPKPKKKPTKYKYRKKNGKMQPYYSKRNRNDPVKIWWWRAEPMPYASFRRIPKRLRPTSRKIIYVKDIRVDIAPTELSNKKKIEEMAILTLGREGEFLMMMFCKRKNSWGVSPVKVATVVIKESGGGLKAEMIENKRLFRYWFWEGRKK